MRLPQIVPRANEKSRFWGLVATLMVIFQQVMTAAYQIGGTVPGDLLHVQLQTNKTTKFDWTRFPDFVRFKTEKLQIRTRPASQSCLPDAAGNEPTILAYLSNFLHPDGLLVQKKGNIIQQWTWDSKRMLEPVLNATSWTTLPEGSQVLFGRLFTSGYNKSMGYRVYYKQSNKIMFYDSLAKTSQESAWNIDEATVALIGSKLQIKNILSKNDGEEYVALVNSGLSPDVAFASHAKVLRVAQDPKTLLLKESVFDLIAGLNDAKIALDGFSSAYLTVVEHSFISGGAGYNTASVVFGFVKPETRAATMYSCLLSFSDSKVAACADFFSKVLPEKCSFLRVDLPTVAQDKLSARVLVSIITDAEKSVVSLQGYTASFKLTPNPTVAGGFAKSDSSVSDPFSQSILSGSTLLVREGPTDFLQFYSAEDNKPQFEMYLQTNGLLVPRAVFVGHIDTSTDGYKYTVPSDNRDRYAERLHVYANGCWDLFDGRPQYFVQIDTGSQNYVDLQTETLPMYEWDSQWVATLVQDVVNFKFNTVIPKITSSNKHFLKWVYPASDLVSVSLPTDTQLTGPYDTVQAEFKPDDEKPDFKVESFSLNANPIKYYYYNNGIYKEVATTSLFGTLDRLVDFQNKKYYVDCTLQKTKDPIVVCKDTHDVEFATGEIVAQYFYGSSIFLAVRSGSNPSSVTVQGFLVSQGTNKKVSYTLAGAYKQISIGARSNTLFVAGLQQDGTVVTAAYDLVADKQTFTKNYKVRGAQSLTYSDNYGALGKFTIYTNGYAVPFYAISSHSALKFKQDEIVAYPAVPLNLDNTAEPVKNANFGCSLKSDYDILSDGSTISWPRYINEKIGNLVSYSIKLSTKSKITQLLCETGRNTFFLAQTDDKRVIKVGTKWNETDLAFGRFSNRTVYDLKALDAEIKILNTYIHGVDVFVLAEIKGAQKIVYLNQQGTEWLLNPEGARSLNKLTFSSETEPKVELMGITSGFFPTTAPKINLSALVQVGAVDRRNISIKLELGPKISIQNHYWGLDVVNGANDKFKIQNRFTYLKDVAVDAHVVLDARYAGQFSALLVKEDQKGYKGADISVLIQGPESFSTSKIPIIPESEIVSPNNIKIVGFSRDTDETKQAPYQVSYKVVVFIQEDTGRSEIAVLLWVNQKWTKYDPMIQLEPHEPRYFKASNIRAVVQKNTTYIAYWDADRKELRAWTENGLLTQGDSVRAFFAKDVEFFDLVSSGQEEVFFITRLTNDPALTIWKVKVSQNSTVERFSSIDLTMLSDKDTPFLSRCLGVKDNSKQDFYCVFWGTTGISLSFKFDPSSSKYTFVFRRPIALYKNLAVEELHFVDERFFVVQGKRTETTWSESRRDTFGLLYYPLDVEGAKNEDKVYASGGVDLKEFLDVFGTSSANNLKLVPGPDGNTFLITLDKESKDKSSSAKLVQIAPTVSATGSGLDLAAASAIEVSLRGEAATATPLHIGDFIKTITPSPVEKQSSWLLWMFIVIASIVVLGVGIIGAMYLRRQSLSEDAEYNAIASMGNEQERTMLEQTRVDKKTVELDNQL